VDDDAPLDWTRLRQLSDRAEIADCITRCARGMDRHDAALMSSSYHDDAIDDHGPYVGPASGFIEHVNGVDGVGGVHAAGFASHQHYLLNQTIDVAGDEAHAETYYLFVGEQRPDGRVMLSGGRYLDRLARREDRWAIAVRRVTMEWMSVLPADVGDHAATIARFTATTWDRSDPSYDRPLQPRSTGPSR
jgi:hypothetical protein